MTLLNDHGQPLIRQYGAKRLNDRTIDELIGLSRGIIADRSVNKAEAEFLKTWLESNLKHTQDPTISQLYFRIGEMLKDGRLDKDEKKELLAILSEFTGESAIDHPEKLASTLPLCNPAPIVEFPEKKFCLTGKFAYGPRRVCVELVEEMGGVFSQSITKKTDYLVIGTFCSTEWIHTSYGRKIEKAAEYRKYFGNIAIISEDHWAQAACRR